MDNGAVAVPRASAGRTSLNPTNTTTSQAMHLMAMVMTAGGAARAVACFQPEAATLSAVTQTVTMLTKEDVMVMVAVLVTATQAVRSDPSPRVSQAGDELPSSRGKEDARRDHRIWFRRIPSR